MNKIIYILFLFLGSFLNAQNFEGIVEMKQTSADGVAHDLTWYIKKDKIAFEIRTKSDRGVTKMRFVPKPKQNSMLMIVATPSGENKNEISAKDIVTEIDLSRSEVKENGVKNSSSYGDLSVLVLTTPSAVTETEVAKSIDVDLFKYAAFLKNDHAVQALIKTRQIGFPVNSVTKDKTGKIISKCSVTAVKRTVVAENYFN
jgi:hypothetical protein